MVSSGKRALSLLILLAALGIWGCSAKSTDQSRMDRALDAINRRDYTQAVKLLEEETRRDPGNQKAFFLLAQSHLGLAGFELLGFLEKIVVKQDKMISLELAGAASCDDGAISNLKQVDFRCLIARVIRHFPDPDNPNLEQAREIFRRHFPNPKAAPLDVNFVSAFVELGSALHRVNQLVQKSFDVDLRKEVKASPEAFPLEFFIHHCKRILKEVMQGFVRAKYSYGKIGKFVATYDGKPLIRVDGGALVFDENLSIETIVRFLGQVAKARGKQVDQELNKTAEQWISDLHIEGAIIRVIRALDKSQFQDGLSQRLELSLKFGRVISFILDHAGDSTDRADDMELQTFRLVWENPPRLFKQFSDSISEAWNREIREPAIEYFESTRDEWNELGVLSKDWEIFVNVELKEEQRAALLGRIREMTKEDPRLLPPQRLEAGVYAIWQNLWMESLRKEIQRIKEHQIPNFPEFTAIQILRLETLLTKTEVWISRNLWEVK